MMLAVSLPKMPDDIRTVPQRVLLIDDDESIAGSLFQYLRTQGCDVDVAVDRAAAAGLMEARQYDVIVVDPYLTGGVLQEDGALLTLIRGSQPEAALFVLTGYGSSSLTISAEREGASAVLTKPQSVVSLSQLIVDARHSVEEMHP
jgi:DNA-binding NtrC family response regulator